MLNRLHVPLVSLTQEPSKRYAVYPLVDRPPCKESWYRSPFSVPEWTTRTLIHASCYCTELNSLMARVCVPQDAVGNVYTTRAIRRMKCGLGQFRLQPLDREGLLTRISGQKRKVYEMAADSLDLYGITEQDSRLSTFCKADKLTGKVDYPTRCRPIQSRGTRFHFELGRFTYPLEDMWYGWKGPKRGVKRVKIFAKGLDVWGRGRILKMKIASFDQPVVLSMDAHTFDGSVRVLDLKDLCELYMAAYPGYESELKMLYSRLYSNTGRTLHGIHYWVKGNRCSGDMDTSLGNSLTSLKLVMAVMLKKRIVKWDCLIDGDDVLLILEKGDLTVAEVQTLWAEHGYDMTCTITGDTGPIVYEEIEFCRGRFCWYNEDEVVLVRDVRRAISTFGTTTKYVTPNELDRYMRVLLGMSICEMHASYYVPCISYLAYAMYARLSKFGVQPVFESGRSYSVFSYTKPPTDRVPVPSVTGEMRASVEKAFGVGIEQQYAYEVSTLRLATLVTNRPWDYGLAGVCDEDTALLVD